MQDVSESSGARRVDDLDQAAVLIDRAWLRLLGAFMERARSMSEAAADLGVTTEWLYRRVKRLEDVGLLKVEDTRARSGRSIKLYRATADAYFVPFSLVPAPHIGSANRAFHAALFEAAIGRTFRRPPFDAHGWGFRTARAPSGDLFVRIVREDGLRWAELGTDAPVMVSGWHVLHLGPDDARELQAEMRALHERFSKRVGATPYLMGIFLADTSDLPGLEHPRREP